MEATKNLQQLCPGVLHFNSNGISRYLLMNYLRNVRACKFHFDYMIQCKRRNAFYQEVQVQFIAIFKINLSLFVTEHNNVPPQFQAEAEVIPIREEKTKHFKCYLQTRPSNCHIHIAIRKKTVVCILSETPRHRDRQLLMLSCPRGRFVKDYNVGKF